MHFHYHRCHGQLKACNLLDPHYGHFWRVQQERSCVATLFWSSLEWYYHGHMATIRIARYIFIDNNRMTVIYHISALSSESDCRFSSGLSWLVEATPVSTVSICYYLDTRMLVATTSQTKWCTNCDCTEIVKATARSRFSSWAFLKYGKYLNPHNLTSEFCLSMVTVSSYKNLYAGKREGLQSSGLDT